MTYYSYRYRRVKANPVYPPPNKTVGKMESEKKLQEAEKLRKGDTRIDQLSFFEFNYPITIVPKPRR